MLALALAAAAQRVVPVAEPFGATWSDERWAQWLEQNPQEKTEPPTWTGALLAEWDRLRISESYFPIAGRTASAGNVEQWCNLLYREWDDPVVNAQWQAGFLTFTRNMLTSDEAARAALTNCLLDYYSMGGGQSEPTMMKVLAEALHGAAGADQGVRETALELLEEGELWAINTGQDSKIQGFLQARQSLLRQTADDSDLRIHATPSEQKHVPDKPEMSANADSGGDAEFGTENVLRALRRLSRQASVTRADISQVGDEVEKVLRDHRYRMNDRRLLLREWIRVLTALSARPRGVEMESKATVVERLFALVRAGMVEQSDQWRAWSRAVIIANRHVSAAMRTELERKSESRTSTHAQAAFARVRAAIEGSSRPAADP